MVVESNRIALYLVAGDHKRHRRQISIVGQVLFGPFKKLQGKSLEIEIAGLAGVPREFDMFAHRANNGFTALIFLPLFAYPLKRFQTIFSYLKGPTVVETDLSCFAT